MSESVEPVVVYMEIENDIDPGTETPYQETSAAKSEVTEQGENKDMSQEDQNKETAEEEEEKKEAEKWKNRERDFFAFKSPGEESSDDGPLEGEELLRELALHKKMRNQLIQYLRKERKAPFVEECEHASLSDTILEDFEGSELDNDAAFMPHPYPL